MSLVKYAGVSLIAMSASMGHAGGIEDTALSAGFMFEDGSYGSVSVKSQSPSVQGTVKYIGPGTLSTGKAVGDPATKGSLIGSVTSTNLKAKMDVLDNMSVGITYYRQAGIKLDYQSNWDTPTSAAVLPKVDLDVTALAALVKYDFNDNISALVGIKNGTASDATVSILAKAVSAQATGKSALSYIIGGAYEIPEIALRAELIYETSAAFSLPTKFAALASPPFPVAFPGDDTGLIDASTPDYINIYVQSGIAEDTLAYVSARQANWKTNQVSITHDFTQGNDDAQPLGTAKDLSSFSDTTSYEVGLGRKFGTTWSSSIAYNWEGGSGPSSSSFFTLTDGRQGLSIGAKYSWNENTDISFGGNYTQFGDTTHDAATGGTAFTGNTATTLGLNISHSF